MISHTEAVEKDQAVRKALKTLRAAEAERDAARARIDSSPLAGLRAEIARVEREGDVKSDIVALYQQAAEAERAIADDEIRLKPLETAVSAAETALVNAELDALDRFFEEERAMARKAEADVGAGVDLIDSGMATIEQLDVQHSTVVNRYNNLRKRPGCWREGYTDLSSLHVRDRQPWTFVNGCRLALTESLKRIRREQQSPNGN